MKIDNNNDISKKNDRDKNRKIKKIDRDKN